ncbi:MAG: hypothetical protein K2J58_03905 [Muribaculaceae bacterium]|nr:hypothetical protein [Muribaculaceae bacterium]
MLDFRRMLVGYGQTENRTNKLKDMVTFHYYTQDYLGNNRAVINGSTGTIEQTVAPTAPSSPKNT